MKANNNKIKSQVDVPKKKEWHWPVITKKYKGSDFFDGSEEGDKIRAVDLEVGDVISMWGDNLFWIEDIVFYNKDDNDDYDYDENSPINPEKTFLDITEETWDLKTQYPKSVIIERIPGTALISVFRLERKTEREDLS